MNKFSFLWNNFQIFGTESEQELRINFYFLGNVDFMIQVEIEPKK